MSRRSLLIASLVLVAGLLSVPIALLLAGSTGQGSQVDSTAPEPSDAEPARQLRPDEVGWVYAAPLFAGPAETYTLQAGTLDEPAPLVDILVPFGIDPNTNPGRLPAVSAVVDGFVVYVADDGRRSSVRRVAVDGNDDEEMAILEEVVYSLVVSPDGSTAYLALGDRADPERDRGIVRLSLDGLARVERIFDPASGARVEPRIAPAAVVGFHVDLGLSLDGLHVLRHACNGPAGCSWSVIDARNRDATDMGDRMVLGAAAGIVLTQRCQMQCVAELVDLASGAQQPLPGIEFDVTLALLDGAPRVVFTEPRGALSVLRALDPRDGSVVDVFRAPRGSSMMLTPPQGQLRLALPAGFVTTEISGEDVGAIVQMHTVAVPLAGGMPSELPAAPIRMELAGIEG
jgi:hypothetical protein